MRKNREPTFLTVLHGKSLSSNLKISRDQLVSLNGEMWSTIYVKGPVSNSVHQIEVESCDLSVTLKYGWKRFVRKNMLQEHDVLLFWREYQNMFSVTIYDKTGRIIREKRAMNEEETGLANRVFSNNNGGGPSRTNGKRNGLSGRDSHFKKGRVDKEILEISSDDDSRDENEISRNKEAESRNGKNVADENNSSDSDSIPSYSDDAKIAQISRSKRVKKAVSKSDRWFVRYKEVLKAKRRAAEFKSENPTFTKEIKNCKVQQIYSMIVPAKFARNHLPRKSTEISLRLVDNEGCKEYYKIWQVNCFYIVSNCQTNWRFISGWKDFVFQNNLKKGDHCVFELTSGEKENDKTKIELTVRIFRVTKKAFKLVPK
ncbi:hypothetical protein LUZ60_016350 [Juncus effusus]|nr:hypothetical protein LUZ60_016350 [Juncus effusus]